MARAIIRQAAGDSRLPTTRAPRGRAVPNATARRVTISGVRSTLTRPDTLSLLEQARGSARLPDQALVDLRAALDLLVGVDAHAGHEHASSPTRHLVAEGDPFLQPGMCADVARAAHDRALDERAAADVRGRVDHGAHRAGALEERGARGQDGVRANLGAGRDPAVVRDQRRPFDLGQVVQLDSFAEPDVAAKPDARDVQLDTLVERVEVRLPVLVEVPDVLPVALHGHPVQRAAHLEQEREELLREVVGPVGGDVLQHLRLEHVHAGVDRVGEDLSPGRLLEEALDASVLVGDHDPELERVLDRFEADRDRCSLAPGGSRRARRGRSRTARRRR